MRAVPSAIGSVYFDVSSRVMNGLIRQLDAAQPFHARVAFPAREKQSRRVSLLGPDRFAVLPVRNQRIVVRLGHRDAAREHGGVLPFGEKPGRLRAGADFAEQRGQRNAGPLAGARQAGDLLRREIGRRAAAAEVAGAFEEVDAADGGEALEIGEREHHRPLDHAVDQQRVGLRIDLGHAAVVPLEMQIGRRDRAVEILVRRAGRRDAARLALRLFGRRPLPERAAGLAADLARIRRGACAIAALPSATTPAAPARRSRRDTFMAALLTAPVSG